MSKHSTMNVSLRLKPFHTPFLNARRVNGYSPLAVDEKLTQKHLLGLVILFWALIAYAIVHAFFHGLTHLTTKIINFLTCGGGADTDKLLSVMNTVQTQYTHALDRGLIKGLATYNVLQNPKYVENVWLELHLTYAYYLSDIVRRSQSPINLHCTIAMWNRFVTSAVIQIRAFAVENVASITQPHQVKHRKKPSSHLG